MKATLFVADLHLDAAARPQTLALFEDFIAVRARRAQALYILGDLLRPGSATTTTAKPASGWPRRWAACSAAACPRTSCTATAISCSARTMRHAPD